ncbi:hypothetical protein ACQ4PT_005810 [Festuca glaucescens]
MIRSTPMMLADDVAVGCGAMVVVAVGSSVFYFVRGTVRSSSRGCRLAGGVQAVFTNGPRVRSWAAYSGVFVATLGAIVDTCDVRDPATMIVAAGATSAFFSVRRGSDAAIRSGLKGAVYGGATWIALHNIIKASPTRAIFRQAICRCDRAVNVYRALPRIFSHRKR